MAGRVGRGSSRVLPSQMRRSRQPSNYDVTMNDDSAEKRERLAERTARSEQERNALLAAAASPRKHVASGSYRSGSPNNTLGGRKEPLLANFEEWMKMATDNKINATNSWNFALIDYFHDMSLLREGDSINFQRASCTLDGCVKIYTSRVDSVATETGKLLSGLADSKTKSKNNQDRTGTSEDENDGSKCEDGMEGTAGKKKRRGNRAESTLVKDFSAIRIKKYDLEFSVDPLFKKTSAEFDEGGAKGLLLNHLALDEVGRLAFDASDATLQTEEEDRDDQKSDTHEIDLEYIRTKYFADLENLEHEDICPSLKDFNLQPDALVEIPLLKFDIIDNDDLVDGNPNMAANEDIPNFVDNGDDWGNESILSQHVNNSTDIEPLQRLDVQDYALVLNSNQENFLSYFDKAIQKNWAGPEHWKIQRLKKDKTTTSAPKEKKEKEQIEIDFSQTVDESQLFAPGNATILSLPKNKWVSRSRHLLPDDKHFDSKRLLKLFLKPQVSLLAKQKASSEGYLEMDNRFWAEANEKKFLRTSTPAIDSQPTYDATFFDDVGADDGFGADMLGNEEDFADAPGSLLPTSQIQEPDKTKLGAGTFGELGSQILQQRRARPEHINYAKRAKRVDVKQLKDNIWKQLNFKPKIKGTNEEHVATCMIADEPRRFTQVLKGLRNVYPEKAMEDISLSMAFIALLHICNEEGLQVDQNQELNDLVIINNANVHIQDII